MTENLNKRPRKSILKSSSSFDKPQSQPIQHHPSEQYLVEHSASKCTKFDEMNIIETLHPADKDYGHMKIVEPKTPFSYLEENSESLDADLLKERINSKLNSPPRGVVKSDTEESCDEESEELTEEKRYFEAKRKAHYNEYSAVKLARQLMAEELEDDEDGDSVDRPQKFIPTEEVEIMEEEEV